MTATAPTRTDPLRDWLGHAARAGRSTAARADLWLPAALGNLVFIGWLPLLLTVVRAPDVGDLAFIGIRLVSATNFPVNVIALGLLVVLGATLACLAAAFAEVVLVAAAARRWPPPGGVTAATRSGLAIIAVVAIPVAGAATALLLGLVAVGPEVFIKTPSEAEIVARVLERLWPFVVAVGVTLLVAHAIGAGAMRALQGGGTPGSAPALAFALRDLLRHPIRRLSTAASGIVVDGIAVVASIALLRLLWAPIGLALQSGRFLEPRTLVLLLGFVAIWLATVLGAGALRAWISTWWSLEAASES
jgi:hypothetical protein